VHQALGVQYSGPIKSAHVGSRRGLFYPRLGQWRDHACGTGHHVERFRGDVNPLAGAAADVRDLTIRAPGLSTAERSVGHRHMPG
jgi:hypothetical protein